MDRVSMDRVAMDRVSMDRVSMDMSGFWMVPQFGQETQKTTCVTDS